MQAQYMEATLRLSASARYVLERKYKLPRLGSLYFRLSNIDQASVVLALVDAELWDDVALLIGHPVPTLCPPCLTKLHAPTVMARTPDDEMIVTWKTNDKRGIIAPMMLRFELVRPGMTVTQLLLRGISRRDIREWRNEGSIKVERRMEKRA